MFRLKTNVFFINKNCLFHTHLLSSLREEYYIFASTEGTAQKDEESASIFLAAILDYFFFSLNQGGSLLQQAIEFSAID